MNKPDFIVILQREGIELKQRGRVLWAHCPLHQDKDPSFKVDPERQTFHCFGCNTGGDVIDFIRAKRKCSFKEALAILGIQGREPHRIDPREERKRQAVKRFRLWCRDYSIALARDLRALRGILAGIITPEDLDLRAWAYHEIPTIEHGLDVIQDGSDEEKFMLFKEARNAKAV